MTCDMWGQASKLEIIFVVYVQMTTTYFKWEDDVCESACSWDQASFGKRICNLRSASGVIF